MRRTDFVVLPDVQVYINKSKRGLTAPPTSLSIYGNTKTHIPTASLVGFDNTGDLVDKSPIIGSLVGDKDNIDIMDICIVDGVVGLLILSETNGIVFTVEGASLDGAPFAGSHLSIVRDCTEERFISFRNGIGDIQLSQNGHKFQLSFIEDDTMWYYIFNTDMTIFRRASHVLKEQYIIPHEDVTDIKLIPGSTATMIRNDADAYEVSKVGVKRVYTELTPVTKITDGRIYGSTGGDYNGIDKNDFNENVIVNNRLIAFNNSKNVFMVRARPTTLELVPLPPYIETVDLNLPSSLGYYALGSDRLNIETGLVDPTLEYLEHVKINELCVSSNIYKDGIRHCLMATIDSHVLVGATYVDIIRQFLVPFSEYEDPTIELSNVSGLTVSSHVVPGSEPTFTTKLMVVDGELVVYGLYETIDGLQRGLVIVSQGKLATFPSTEVFVNLDISDAIYFKKDGSTTKVQCMYINDFIATHKTRTFSVDESINTDVSLAVDVIKTGGIARSPYGAYSKELLDLNNQFSIDREDEPLKTTFTLTTPNSTASVEVIHVDDVNITSNLKVVSVSNNTEFNTSSLVVYNPVDHSLNTPTAKLILDVSYFTEVDSVYPIRYMNYFQSTWSIVIATGTHLIIVSTSTYGDSINLAKVVAVESYYSILGEITLTNTRNTSIQYSTDITPQDEYTTCLILDNRVDLLCFGVDPGTLTPIHPISGDVYTGDSTALGYIKGMTSKTTYADMARLLDHYVPVGENFNVVLYEDEVCIYLIGEDNTWVLVDSIKHGYGKNISFKRIGDGMSNNGIGIVTEDHILHIPYGVDTGNGVLCNSILSPSDGSINNKSDALNNLTSNIDSTCDKESTKVTRGKLSELDMLVNAYLVPPEE